MLHASTRNHTKFSGRSRGQNQTLDSHSILFLIVVSTVYNCVVVPWSSCYAPQERAANSGKEVSSTAVRLLRGSALASPP